MKENHVSRRDFVKTPGVAGVSARPAHRAIDAGSGRIVRLMMTLHFHLICNHQLLLTVN
jgi:hypothetical protein